MQMETNEHQNIRNQNLKPKDNSVSTSVIPKPSPEPTQHQVFPESVQHQVFDLTAADTQDDDELTGADIPGAPVGAFPNLVRPCHPSGSGNAICTEEVQPAWIQELTKSLQGLHVKSDQTHNYCLELGSEPTTTWYKTGSSRSLSEGNHGATREHHNPTSSP